MFHWSFFYIFLVFQIVKGTTPSSTNPTGFGLGTIDSTLDAPYNAPQPCTDANINKIYSHLEAKNDDNSLFN